MTIPTSKLRQGQDLESRRLSVAPTRLLVTAAALLTPCVAFSQVEGLSSEALVKRAEAAYHAQHYQESVALYSQSLPLLPESERAGTEYNMACAQALAGEHNEALTTLTAAVQDGYADRKDTEADKDLISLHGDPRWTGVLDRMTALVGEQDARWGSKAFTTAYAPDLPPADKVAGLSELWAQAKFGFANFWHVPQLNWDQTYRDFIPQVLSTTSTLAYYQVLQRFYARLQDGHSNVYFPQQIYDQMARLPLRTRLIDGHLLVLGSRDPAADLQGLKPGDEILTIDGIPAVAWAEKTVGPFASASSPQDRNARVFEYVPFFARIGTTFTLQTATPKGQKAEHRFTIADDKPSSKVPFSFRMLPGNIAYVALNEFEDDIDATEWDKHWAEISVAQGVILDIRENGGGSDSIGAHVLSALIEKPVPASLSRSTRWIATYRAWGNLETPLRFPLNTVDPDNSRHFGGKVVLLTSPRTFSAGEDLAVAFKQAKRGLIVGEPTGGSTGQPLSFDLPGGGTARICTKHDSFADGTEFVGVGVQPDIPVHISRENIIMDQDAVLQAALASFRRKD